MVEILLLRFAGFATVFLNLGHAESDLGRTTDALSHLQLAYDTYKLLHGDTHRTIGVTLNYIGSTLLRMGKVNEGKAKLERAVTIMDEMYDSSYPGICEHKHYLVMVIVWHIVANLQEHSHGQSINIIIIIIIIIITVYTAAFPQSSSSSAGIRVIILVHPT